MVIDRHCQVAVVLDEFHRRLLTESKKAAYPTAELEMALRMSVTGARYSCGGRTTSVLSAIFRL